MLVDANAYFDFHILENHPEIVVVLFSSNINIPASQQAFMHKLLDLDLKNPVVLANNYADTDSESIQIKAGTDFGSVLLNGFGDGIWLSAPAYNKQDEILRYSFGILQASRLRTTKTEFISCPGCGRTLFDLQSTIKAVKDATSHLPHLKIGIMGCIVNGPGEMADADYGYVGAAVNKISLYKGKQCIEMNIPQEDAIPKLIKLIKDNGDWIKPA